MTSKPPITSKLFFTRDEYAERIAKVRRAMEARGIDLLIISDPSNMNWLTGYDGWSFYVHQCVVLPLTGEPVWYGRGQDANGALRTCFMAPENIIGYPDHYVQSDERHPMDYLSAQLTDWGWAKGTIAVEMDNYWFSAAAYGSLVSHMPNARFVDAKGLVNWQRAVKSPQELDYMRTAGKIVGKMHKRIAETIKPGLRKCDLVAEIYDASLRFDPELGGGGGYPAIVPLLPSGADAAAPHLTWDDLPMKSGEGTFFEIAGVFNRYHCPLSRTVFLGKPTQTFLDAEKAVLEGMEAGLEVARAGNHCEDIAIAFFNVLRKHGLEKDNRTGYAIGVSYPPDWGERTMSLRQGDKTVLEENMTFHFMTGLWMEDWGFEITESIRITDGEPECLADVPAQTVCRGVSLMQPSPIVPTIPLNQDGVHHGFLRLPYSRDDSAWGSIMIPITVIQNGTGPTALLTGGNHGDEYEGPVVLQELASTLRPEDLMGRVIIVPTMNFPAFQEGRRTSPIDKGNLNRSFPGSPTGTPTQKIADYFQCYLVPQADVVLDFHSGGKTLDFVPFAAVHILDDKAQEARCVAAMEAFNAPYSVKLLEIDSVGMYDTAVEEMGKVFVSTELGGGGSSSARSNAIARKGLRNLLIHAGMLKGEMQMDATVHIDMPDGDCFSFAEAAGLHEPMVDLGESVQAGDVLARVWPADRTGGQPVEILAKRAGLLVARHFPGLIKIGDCAGVIGVEVGAGTD